MLNLRPQISQKELAGMLDISNQALGEMLGKLEKKGYLTRRQSTKDRRVMMVELTEAGRRSVDTPAEGGEDVNDMFACLTQEEKVILTGYVERLVSSLETQTGKEDSGPFRHSYMPSAQCQCRSADECFHGHPQVHGQVHEHKHSIHA